MLARRSSQRILMFNFIHFPPALFDKMSTFCDHAAWTNNLKIGENIYIHLYICMLARWLGKKTIRGAFASLAWPFRNTHVTRCWKLASWLTTDCITTANLHILLLRQYSHTFVTDPVYKRATVSSFTLNTIKAADFISWRRVAEAFIAFATVGRTSLVMLSCRVNNLRVCLQNLRCAGLRRIQGKIHRVKTQVAYGRL
jgi:hypothetical protein